MSRKPVIAYEYGTLYVEGEKHKDDDIALAKSSFDSLWNFILENKTENDVDNVMSVHSRGGRRFIKLNKYIGTIQTCDGLVIEILPKVYNANGRKNAEAEKCRKIVLKMLRHYKEDTAKSFQNIGLSTKESFPILELYVCNYLNELESLLVQGLKKNYTFVEENQRFIKGKLLVGLNIQKNGADKSKQYCRYSKYIENIPQNRIIVTTLKKLLQITKNSDNELHIHKLQTILSDIPLSCNVEDDINKSLNDNRLYSSYSTLMQWSSQILFNKGYTTFFGTHVNQALLFPAEKLFENFIAYLFKKYAPKHIVDKQFTQHKKYFLVDRHDGKSLFKLRPDIFIESVDNDCVIIDTKWKSIDASSPDKNYLIDIKDMYQLYAYGQKYEKGRFAEFGFDSIPNLVLVYPYTEKFNIELKPFIYNEIKENIGLKLMVVPFDLTESSDSYEKQICKIISCLEVKKDVQPVYKTYDLTQECELPMAAEDQEYYGNETMLVGCYKNRSHHDWILSNKKYNVRFGNRVGAVTKSKVVVSASILLLYDFSNPSKYDVFRLNSKEHIVAKYDLMKSLKYPDAQVDNEYLLYIIDRKIEKHKQYDVTELKTVYAKDLPDGAPFYVRVR